MSDLSNCCKMPIEVVCDDEGEGTCFYRCSKCGEACNAINLEDHREER